MILNKTQVEDLILLITGWETLNNLPEFSKAVIPSEQWGLYINPTVIR